MNRSDVVQRLEDYDIVVYKFCISSHQLIGSESSRTGQRST